MTKSQATKMLIFAQQKKVRAVYSLLNDESVPIGIAIVAKALRAAAHKFDHASEQGRYDALVELYSAAMTFDEELEKL